MARHKKNFAVIGLDDFGSSVLEALLRRGHDVVVVDRNEAKIQSVKDRATLAVRADVLDRSVFDEVFPETVECAIVGLGDEEHAATLVTHHLKEMGIARIVVEAMDPQHAEILAIVGASRVVNPQKEAAEHVVGLLANSGMVDYFPVSDDFCLIEIHVPADWASKTLAELDLQLDRIQVVAVRHAEEHPGTKPGWHLLGREEPLSGDDIVLVAGTRAELDDLVG